jgi:hypothetical protein
LEDNCIFSALIRKGAFAATPKAARPEKSRYVADLPDESRKNPFFSQNFTPILTKSAQKCNISLSVSHLQRIRKTSKTIFTAVLAILKNG